MIFKCTWYRSSSLAFLPSRNTFAYWVILLCRGISPFADANILTALLPVSHTKTVFRYTHKAVGLLHRLWTPSRWPAVSPPTFVRVSVPPSISFCFKLKSCVFFAGGQEHCSTICHYNTHEARLLSRTDTNRTNDNSTDLELFSSFSAFLSLSFFLGLLYINL